MQHKFLCVIPADSICTNLRSTDCLLASGGWQTLSKSLAVAENARFGHLSPMGYFSQWDNLRKTSWVMTSQGWAAMSITWGNFINPSGVWLVWPPAAALLVLETPSAAGAGKLGWWQYVLYSEMSTMKITKGWETLTAYLVYSWSSTMMTDHDGMSSPKCSRTTGSKHSACCILPLEWLEKNSH